HGAVKAGGGEFGRPGLDCDGIVVDTGRAPEVLRAILADMNFRNLDDDPAFKGHNTTTEFLARVVFDRMAAAIRKNDLGPAAQGIESLRVTLHESHVASAAFEGPLPKAAPAPGRPG